MYQFICLKCGFSLNTYFVGLNWKKDICLKFTNNHSSCPNWNTDFSQFTISPINKDWISIENQLPKPGQFCRIKYTLPKGFHYYEASECTRRIMERDGVTEKKKNEIIYGEYKNIFYVNTKEDISNMKNSPFIDSNIAKEITGYGWHGLRIDINKFVTHWKKSLLVNKETYINKNIVIHAEV